MGPMNLYFDVRDIFRAPRLALSGKKILIFLIGLIGGWIVYWLLTYLALGLAGVSFASAWQKFGLYPCLYATEGSSWYAQLVYWIGILIWFFTINLACTAVARVTYKQLKGDEFYSSGDSWKYVKKHWHPIIFTSISLIIIIIIFLFVAVLFGAVSKIPWIGEFLFALPYLFYFFGAVFTVYTVVVLATSLVYTPTIVGAYEEDTMGAVFQSYSITWSQPWRIVLYHMVLLPLVYLAVYIFGAFWYGGYKLINLVFGADWLLGMGLKLSNIVGYASEVVFPACISSGNTCAGGFCGLFPVPGVDMPFTHSAAGVITAIFLFILFASVIAYGLSILSVGETLMFIIFKKKSDDDNLLERKDEEELEAEEEEEEENETEPSTDDSVTDESEADDKKDQDNT